MNRDTSHVWVEGLENRRLLSSTNIVGTYTGTFQDTGSNTDKGTLTIVVTSETHTGHVSGTITSKAKGQHTMVQTFTGKIKGNDLTLSTNVGSDITGTASRHGNDLAGKFSSSQADGTFSAVR